MTDNRQASLEYAQKNHEEFLNQLIDLCKLPSISTDPDASLDIERTAKWVAEKLTSIGIENVKIMPTAKHPVVYGDYLHAGSPPSITPLDSEGVQALSAALETVWGSKPMYYRVGGSIPVVAQMETILGVNSVLTGFGLPDDNLHAPNEKLTLGPWYMGIDALIHFFYNLVG